MTYVFDTSSFRVLGNYYPERFPSFWERFNKLALSGDVLSVREARLELERQNTKPHLDEWIETHKPVFVSPGREETEFVANIFRVGHFKQLVSKSNIHQGRPAADPFLIAAAFARQACVVTEESMTDGAAKIPNVCDHFGVEWSNVEGFLEREGWSF